MSVPSVILECAECGATYSQGVVYGDFSYQLPDGSKLPLYRSLGWCHDCAGVVAMEDISGGLALGELERANALRSKLDEEQRRSFFSRLVGSKQEEIARVNEKIAALHRAIAFLRGRSSPPKCLECGSSDVEQLPSPPSPPRPEMKLPAGWSHPGCGGSMVAWLSEDLLSFSYPQRLFDANGISFDQNMREGSIDRAAAVLFKEFGIKLSVLPDPRPVEDLFETMSAAAELSHEACVSLLYRLVVFNYLATAKLMRDGGRNTPIERLTWLTPIVDRAVDWSDASSDQVTLERITSQLNMNTMSLFRSFGIHAG